MNLLYSNQLNSTRLDSHDMFPFLLSFFFYVFVYSEETTLQLMDDLEELLKTNPPADTKRLIDTVIGLGDLDMDYACIESLEYRDTSTRTISRVLGRGAFKMVLKDDVKALAVFLKKDDEDDSPRNELLNLQEILTSVLLSSHRGSMPNFLHVDAIFRTKTCRRFFSEDTIAFRMELCNAELDDELVSDETPGPRLSLRQFDGYFFQLCCALAYMHSVLDIYHLDIKPSNILLTSLGDATVKNATFRYTFGAKQFSITLPQQIALLKIADLGSSMPGVSSYFHTTSGTLSYRPPEYFLQGLTGPAGSCTDVFAVGLMMLEAYLGMGHDEFIEQLVEQKLCFSDEIEDFLFEHVDSPRLCQLVYGYFVLFSTRDDIELYRQVKTEGATGWPIGAGDVTLALTSMLDEDDMFQCDWRLYSIQCGSDKDLVELRAKICQGEASDNHTRLNAFLSMLRLDPSKRATAATLVTSPLFAHLEVKGGGRSNDAGNVVCCLSEDLF